MAKKNCLTARSATMTVKKISSLKKHMLAKHEDHMCKECQEKFSSFMELLKHVANHHHKEEIEAEDNMLKEDANIPNEIEERDELEDLEAELKSLKTELKLK